MPRDHTRASQVQRLDASDGLPFSPFEVTEQNGKTDWKLNSIALADIFAYVVGLGGIQKDLLQNAIQDAYKVHGYAADDVSERTLPTTQEVLKNIEQREQKQKVRNVAARCRPLLEMDLFKPVAGDSSLLTQIRQGLVIDLHDLMSETIQLAAGAFVLRKLYRDMFRWGTANAIRLAIVLDEAHRLAKDLTLPKLMKEGRKYGIAVVVASQGLSDFHPDVLGNAGTKVIFRTNYPESGKLARYVQPRTFQEAAAQIEQLNVANAFVQTPEMPEGVVVHMRSSEL
jgi:DNA phosphorothioation-dependent restriction protein DptH